MTSNNGQWTRNDLPSAPASVTSYLRSKGTRGGDVLLLPGVHGILDAVVEYLNAHHPKLGIVPGFTEKGTAAIRETLDRLVYERDEWKARAEQAENARDTAATRAEQLEKALAGSREAHQRSADAHMEWKARAVKAEARTAPAVTREQIEEQLRIAYEFGNDPVRRIEYAADNMCALFCVEAEATPDPVEVRVSTRRPQDYVLVDEGTGSRWRITSDGKWVAEEARDE